MSIPIRNIYYLLCYAWDDLDEGELIDLDLEGSGPTANLLAAALGSGVAHLLRQGLRRDYVVQENEIAGIRGKLQPSPTVKRNLLWNGRTVCAFDELHYDILPNQILKATLRRLLSTNLLDRTVSERLIGPYRRLSDISDIELSHRSFRTVQLHRNVRLYSFLMSLCRLTYDNLLVDEETGQSTFKDFIRDEQQMPRLFQRFVFNFLRQEQTRVSVSSPQIRWKDVKGTSEDLAFLPVMQTDIVLSSNSRQIIIDTKYYKEAFQSRFQQPKIKSGNLYQIDSYLTNTENPNALPMEGVLLYPAVEREFSLSYQIRGRSIKVRSIDLAQPWQSIRQSLLKLVAA
jgi:5-methylcytosine-specific restriction enzyme subunit McrC